MQKVLFNCTKMIENDLQIKLDMLKLLYMCFGFECSQCFNTLTTSVQLKK